MLKQLKPYLGYLESLTLVRQFWFGMLFIPGKKGFIRYESVKKLKAFYDFCNPFFFSKEYVNDGSGSKD